MKKKKISEKKKFMHLIGDVWPYDIIIAFGVSEKEFIEYTDRGFEEALSKQDLDNLSFEGKKGRTVQLSNHAVVLWLKEYPDSPERFGILAHEIFHVADIILNTAGLRLVAESDEAWAYFIDWITKSIYRYFELA